MKHQKHKWKQGLIQLIFFSDVQRLVDMRNSERFTKHIYDYMENSDLVIKNSQHLFMEKQEHKQLGVCLIKQNYHLILFLGMLSLTKDVLYIINIYLLDQLSSTLKNINDQDRDILLTQISSIIIQQLLGTFINAQLILKLSILKNRIYEQTTILVLQKQLKIYLYQTSNIDPIVLLSDDIGQIYEIFEILRKSLSGLLTFVFSFMYLIQVDENIWQTISLIIIIAQIYNFTLCYFYIISEKRYKGQKEIRTQLMSQILNGIKQIKLLNWEKLFEQKIMNIRTIEFRQLAYMKILDGFGSVFWNNLTYLLLASYLIAQFSKGLSFEDLNIIPIITMFNTLNFPLGILPWNINNILVGKISYDRIVQFLQLQEVITTKYKQSTTAITINQLDFGWLKDQKQILINNLQLKSNTIIGIVGAIGSGKSTFIKSLVNEIQLNPSQTSIVNGQIAYCPQTPWLINDSIRNNILFGLEYKENFYNNVLDMCEIIQDINQFQERDLRLVGLNGCQMSGGQKQRIVLARAIYQNADIYIFDDPLTSCDFEVSKLIIQKAFSYLIKQQKSIIISSNHHRLFEQINFDRVLEIVDGQIQDQQIKQFQSLSDNIFEVQKILYAGIQDNLNQEDIDDNQIKLSLQTWLMWFSHIGWKILILFTITNFMMQICFSYIDFWLNYKMEKQNQENYYFSFQIALQLSNTQAIAFLITISLIVTAIRGLFYALISITSGWYSFKKLNTSLMNSKLEFYEKTQIGSILSRTSVDTYVIDTELTGRFHVFYEDISKVSGMLIGLLYLFPNVWIILVYAIYSSFILSKKFSEYNTQLNNICSDFQDQLLTQFNEIIQGTESIRVFGKQKHFQNIFLSKLQKYLSINSLQQRSQCWFQLRINLISNLLVAIIMFYICFTENHISQGQIILCITYSLGLFDNLNQIFTFYIDFQGLLISFERVRQFYFIKQENLHLSNQQSKQIQDLNQNIISFQNVSLQYNNQEVLKDISFEIKQNQKIAILGRTGSGKTSILNVLFRLYDYNGGYVKLKGVDINEINLSELRRLISIIPQSGFIFEGTLLENLNPKNQLKQQEVISFLNKIKLQFDNLSSNLTDPYFQIKPNGDNLSTGEKQIVNILRALLQDSEIICLDEAQSSIDSETNKIINKIFNEFTKNKTVISISHNLYNLYEYDMIIMMSNGKIIQVTYKNS